MGSETKLGLAVVVTFIIGVLVLVMLVAIILSTPSNNKDDYIKTCIEATDLTHVQCEFEYLNKGECHD